MTHIHNTGVTKTSSKEAKKHDELTENKLVQTGAWFWVRLRRIVTDQLVELFCHFIAVRFFNTNAYNIFSFILFCRPYFRRRSNALEGMAVASFIGVTSGIYIWKPVLEEMQQNRVERERLEAVEGSVSNKNEGN